MIVTAEGVVDIELTEFWEWVRNQSDLPKATNLVFDLPTINKANQSIEVKFAFGSEESPTEWFKKPEWLE